MASPSTPGITGYRVLTDAEKAAMNSVKDMENIVGLFIRDIEAIPGVDQRWLALGITSLQVGFMQVVRAVAQPKSELAPVARK